MNFPNPFSTSSKEELEKKVIIENRDVNISNESVEPVIGPQTDNLQVQSEEGIIPDETAIPQHEVVTPQSEFTAPQPEVTVPQDNNSVSQDDITNPHLENADSQTEEIHAEDTSDKANAKLLEFPDYTEQFDTLKGSLVVLQDIVENLQYNVSILVQNQATAADVAVMRRENEAFRSDSNMKLMRRYGIDAMIKTYQAICDKLFRINHPQSGTQSAEGEQKAFEWVLKRMERQFKQLGIRLQRSGTGSEFDGATMTVYGSEGEDVEEEETIFETNEESLKDTVKESVCPAFMWTIPSLIGDAKEWCMESEKVCIYK